jgi:hypothetical protein
MADASSLNTELQEVMHAAEVTRDFFETASVA